MRTYPIRGITKDGAEVWYTGKAGDGFVSPNKADAFTAYGLDGARRKATQLNAGTPLHGIRFVVPVPGADPDPGPAPDPDDVSAAERAVLDAIGCKHFDRDTLDTRKSDSLDFFTTSVWQVRRALLHAYRLGQRSKNAAILQAAASDKATKRADARRKVAKHRAAQRYGQRQD